MSKSKDGGRKVEEVFTASGKQYQVKCNVVLYDLKQALALRAIITSFETSALRKESNRVHSA